MATKNIEYKGETYEHYIDIPVGFAKQATARLKKVGIKVVLRPKGKDGVTMYTHDKKTSKQSDVKLTTALDTPSIEEVREQKKLAKHAHLAQPYAATRIAIPSGTRAISITPVHMTRVHPARRGGGLTRRSNR
jgi:hypothetical protein